MAWTFPTTKQAYFDNANWLDGITSLSFACDVRLDTFSAGVNQGIFGHTGSTNYFRFQKLGTTDLWNFYVTSGGIPKFVSDTTGSPAAGTIYHMAGTWVPGSATGLAIYRNGALVTTASTATQSGAYNSGGNVDLYLNSIAHDNRIGYCSLENLAIWINYVLDAGEVAALYWVGWPHLAVAKAPAVFWQFNQELLTRLPDASGNARHIEAAQIDTGVTAGGLMGKYEDPWQGWSGGYRQSAAGPPAPNPWELAGTVNHPVVTKTVGGLTNTTTYEFSVIAKDNATPANESTRSTIVEATPSASGITYVHVPRRVWGGR